MQGWIGSDTFGRVERLGDEAIETEFWCVVVPVWPLASVYAGPRGAVPIPLHRRSVIAGYLRVTTWLAALIVGLPGLVDPARWAALLPAGAALAIAAAWLTWGYGRLSRDEHARRALLRRVAGIGAPPELLPIDVRDEVREALVDRWLARGGARPWADAIVDGVADELLVALAEYHGRHALAARARERLARADVR